MTYCQSKPKNKDIAETSKLIQAYQKKRKKNDRKKKEYIFLFACSWFDIVQLSLLIQRESQDLEESERERKREDARNLDSECSRERRKKKKKSRKRNAKEKCT